MSSVAFSGIVAGHSANLAHVLGRKFESQPGSEVTPIVFVVDSEASERESLALLIRSKGWRPQMFKSIDEFTGEHSSVAPSCLVLEVSRDCNFVELKRFAMERPEMPVILIASCGDVRMAVEAIKAGAFEFLTKSFIEDLLPNAVEQALERSRVSLSRHALVRDLKDRYATLTPREKEVMMLVVAGLMNKQVGAELDITERTVKGHRGRMMEKMRANSLAELVKMAARLRLPSPLGSTIAACNPLSAQAVA